MNYYYELIKKEDNLPVKSFIHSVNNFETHWHNELEILLCLEGSVTINIGKNIYLVKKDEFVIISKNEPHSIHRTNESNVLLAVQIDSLYISNIYPDFNNMYFESNLLKRNKSNKEDILIKKSMSKILLETSKKIPGYEFRVASEVNLLVSYIIDTYDYEIINRVSLDYSERNRMKRVIDYINENAFKEASLKEIANKENVSVNHLSRIFKENIGINFHNYLVNIRLFKAKDLLLSSDLSIMDISYKSGFPSIKSLNRYFKKEFNQTPSDFRKTFKYENKIPIMNSNINEDDKDNIARSYLDVDRYDFLNEIVKYIDEGDLNEIITIDSSEINKNKFKKLSLDFDILKEGKTLEPYWSNLITMPRAHDFLKSSIKNELSLFNKNMEFKYIRFHGIFSDEMMVVNFNKYEDIIYNWTYIDEALDYLLSIGIKPFVELAFMPREIKSSDQTVFFWKANISMPKDIKLWNDLVANFIKHVINRYGIKEIRSWYFEVWNQPELEGLFWTGTKEDYFEFYRNTYLTIKSIDKMLKVGGPSITHESVLDDSWISNFLDYLKKKNLEVDFITIHIYPELYTSENDIELMMNKVKEGKDESYILNNWSDIGKIYHGKNHLKKTVKNLNEILKDKLDFYPEIHITEWNASAFVRNYIHDTCFVATFILYNVIQNINNGVKSLGYWTMTDLIEENKLGISHFHGGFGLINKDGIKKPSYYAYYFLSKLGSTILYKGNNYIITKDENDDEFQIIIFNFTYFNDLFIQGETSFLTNENRYDIYDYKEDVLFDFTLKNLEGTYKILKYKLDRENGSAFDEWKSMGMPENMSKEEVEYLNRKSFPSLVTSNKYIDGDFILKETIPAHGSMLIILKKQYN